MNSAQRCSSGTLGSAERLPARAEPDAINDRVDVLALKKRGFNRILDVEENHLTHSQDLIAALRRCVGAIGA